MTREEARAEIVAIASAMLSGNLSFIEGALALTGLRWVAELDYDEDMLPFVGICSETDAFPLGEVRKLWQPAALERLQPAMEDAERWANDFGTPHCRRLVERFGPGK